MILRVVVSLLTLSALSVAQPEKWFPLQEAIVKYHGLQNGCSQAEAFYRVSTPSLYRL